MKNAILGTIFGALVAIPVVPAFAQVACPSQSDLQSVVNTLIAYTTELVKEVDAIKLYGASSVPVVGSGVVIPGTIPSTPSSASNPVPTNTQTTSSTASVPAGNSASDEAARIKKGSGPSYTMYTGTDEGAYAPPYDLHMQVNYYPEDNLVVDVNGVQVQPTEQFCSQLTQTLTGCTWRLTYSLGGINGTASVVIHYRGYDKALYIAAAGNTTLNGRWNGTSW